MRINTGLKGLAGAVALALSAGAMANTNAGSTGTIFVVIQDTTQGTEFVFDTSLAAGTDPASGQNWNLATNSASSANYALFQGTVQSGDTVKYSVLGVLSGGANEYVDTTGLATPTVISGSNGNGAAVQVGTFLGQINNASGGSTFTPASANGTSKWSVGYDTQFSGGTGLGVTDAIAVGTAANFYQTTITNPSATRNGASSVQLSQQWDLTSAGALTYGTASAVPLPAPLVLLLSGLGLMGVVTRRRQAGMNGLAS